MPRKNPVTSKVSIYPIWEARKQAALKAKLLEEQKKIKQDAKESVLADLPLPLKEWTLQARPMIGPRPNYLKYVPWWLRIYEDEALWIMLLFARQLWKSTYDSSLMGNKTTTIPGTQAAYVTYEDESLSQFSNQKFRQELWNTDILRPHILGPGLGEVHRVALKNSSVNNLVTDANEFHHIEGKSADILIFDEAQYLDLDQWAKASESQSFTQGRFVVSGIGGYVNTEYHKWWLDTDQREWHYDNELWRDKLEFNSEGLVWDDYLIDVLAGYWRATKSENEYQHGYHMSQFNAPWTPLTIDDAIKKYKTHPRFSIEYRRNKNSSIHFAQHVEAKFVEGDIKPITDSMMFKLYDRTVSFTEPEDVNYSLGDVFHGTDWGGGSKTIEWYWQYLNEQDKFQLLHAEMIETADVDKQYQIVKQGIDSYKPKQSIVDAGGGTFQVQQLEAAFPSVLRRNSYLTRPESPLPTRTEETKLRKENRYTIDRTFSLDRIINLITNQKIILPAADPSKVDWIVEQFCNIEAEIVKLKSTGQTYRRYFHQLGRPDDALHACNYAYIAYDISKNSEWSWISG